MIRLTEIKLPLQHQDEQAELRAAILAKLGISDSDLNHFSVFKRGIDARKKSDIQLIYTLDIEIDNEAVLLKKFAKDQHVKPSPDTSYKFVAQAPATLNERPIVIGFLYSPLQQILDNSLELSTAGSAHDDQTVFDTASVVARDVMSASLQTDTVHIDGKRVVLEGQEEVVLKCGEASITLTRNGKVVIRGKYLLSRSSGVNRILGGSVQVN